MNSAYKNALYGVLLAQIANKWFECKHFRNPSSIQSALNFDTVMQNSGVEKVELLLPVSCFGKAPQPRNKTSRQLHGAS